MTRVTANSPVRQFFYKFYCFSTFWLWLTKMTANNSVSKFVWLFFFVNVCNDYKYLVLHQFLWYVCKWKFFNVLTLLSQFSWLFKLYIIIVKLLVPMGFLFFHFTKNPYIFQKVINITLIKWSNTKIIKLKYREFHLTQSKHVIDIMSILTSVFGNSGKTTSLLI